MGHKLDEGLLLFLALVGLYSPIAAVSSYVPLLQPYPKKEQVRIALGMFLNVVGIAVVTILVGEPLLVLLGLSTAALSATGGIALMIAAVPLMLGWGGDPEPGPDPDSSGQPGVIAPWSSVVFVPFTFPLTIGGATVGLLVSFRAQASGAAAVGILLVAAVTYAAVTGLCVYIAGHAERRLSGQARSVLDRVAGILLVAIAATLLAGGFTRLVVDVLHNIRVL